MFNSTNFLGLLLELVYLIFLITGDSDFRSSINSCLIVSKRLDSILLLSQTFTWNRGVVAIVPSGVFAPTSHELMICF